MKIYKIFCFNNYESHRHTVDLELGLGESTFITKFVY